MKRSAYKCQTCGFRYNSLPIERGNETYAYCSDCNTWKTFKRVRGTTKDSEHKIFMPLHNASFTVDEDTSELDMRNAEPLFFAKLRGERATYSTHKGFVVRRYNLRHSNGWTERCTAVFAFGRWPREFLGSHHITSNCSTIAQAIRLIDRILTANRWDSSMED